MTHRQFMKAGALWITAIVIAGAQTLNVGTTCNVGYVYQKPAPSTGGPDVYYYGSAGSTASTLIAYWNTGLLIGDAVTATTGGTITMIGGKFVETLGATNAMAISLWTNSGSAWVLHECVEFVLAANWAGGWTNATLSTPLVVGDGTTVRVMFTSSDVGLNVGWYGGSEASGAFREPRTWANRCSSTEPSWLDDEHAGARIYVD